MHKIICQAFFILISCFFVKKKLLTKLLTKLHLSLTDNLSHTMAVDNK